MSIKNRSPRNRAKPINKLCWKCGGDCCKELYLYDRIRIGWATKTLILGWLCPHLKDGLCSIYDKRPKFCSEWECGLKKCMEEKDDFKKKTS